MQFKFKETASMGVHIYVADPIAVSYCVVTVLGSDLDVAGSAAAAECLFQSIQPQKLSASGLSCLRILPAPKHIRETTD